MGTHDEFRLALAEMKKLGVHPLLMANFGVADTATRLFEDKLRRFAVQGRFAEDLEVNGWGEGTISTRLGLARSNFAKVSPAHPEFRKLLVDQFTDLVRDKAEGFQLDKNAQPRLDFNPSIPTSPDRSLTEELLATYREIQRMGREVNPDFAIASEASRDRLLQFVDVSYVRIGDCVGPSGFEMSSPSLLYTFPEWTTTICTENPGDFNIMNNGMRYGLVWAMQPRHHNDSMDEPLTQPLSRFVQELIRIRTKHKDVLFHGRFRDTVGAEVKGGAVGSVFRL